MFDPFSHSSSGNGPREDFLTHGNHERHEDSAMIILQTGCKPILCFLPAVPCSATQARFAIHKLQFLQETSRFEPAFGTASFAATDMPVISTLPHFSVSGCVIRSK